MTIALMMAGFFGFGGGNNNPQSNNPAPQQQQQPQQTNPQQQDPLKMQQPNPSNNPDPNNPNPNNPPSDIFANLWDNTPEDPNNPKQTNSIYGNVNLEQVMKSAGNLDFTKNIDPELIQAATSGDVNALLQIINQVGQQSYANSLLGGMRVFDQGAEARFNSFNNELPSLINQHTTFNQTRELSPLASNPSTKPVYDMISKQIINKNPNATQKEINDTVMQYVTMLQQMGNTQTPNDPNNPNNPPAPDAQWKDFFS